MKTNREDNEDSHIGFNQDQTYSLTLYNDDYHTYDYVINALVEICGLDVIQATQCTFLIHFKEKCEVKRGPRAKLIPMQKALIKLDLKAIIN